MTNSLKIEKLKYTYEKLALAPEETVKSICEFIGIAYEGAMLRYWEHEHHHTLGNAGTNRMIIKYKESQSKEQKKDVEWLEKHGDYYDQNYYDKQEFGIKFDERWKDELSAENIEKFNIIVGDLNQQFILDV